MRTISIPINDISENARQVLEPRQQGGTVYIHTVYQGLNAGPAPGAVVGTVLGSVLGFVFLIWLLWILSNGSGFIRSNHDEEDVVITRRRSRSPRRHRRGEMSQRLPRRDRVYCQERITRDFLPLQRSPGTSRVQESVLVDVPRVGRRVGGDDLVEVIEERSSVGPGGPPRRNSRR